MAAGTSSWGEPGLSLHVTALRRLGLVCRRRALLHSRVASDEPRIFWRLRIMLNILSIFSFSLKGDLSDHALPDPGNLRTNFHSLIFILSFSCAARHQARSTSFRAASFRSFGIVHSGLFRATGDSWLGVSAVSVHGSWHGSRGLSLKVQRLFRACWWGFCACACGRSCRG